MEDRKFEKKFDNLHEIKQKGSELKHTIESIRLDGTQTWKEILKIYSLASSTIHSLQAGLNTILEHRVVVPSYTLHEDPNYVPSIIATKLNDNIETETKSVIEEFNSSGSQYGDVEEQVNRFNSFCHELRVILKK